MKLTTLPAPVLQKPCERLQVADLKAGTYDSLITEMKSAMREHDGIGLTANQIGKDLALFVIDETLAEEQGVPSVYANPEITDRAKEQEDMKEGCLSIPGFWVPVSRAKKIMFKALNGKGEKVKFRARGLLARVLQHETDHCNGLTIQERAKKDDSQA